MKKKVIGLLLSAMLASSSMCAYAQEAVVAEGEQIVQAMDSVSGRTDAKEISTNQVIVDKITTNEGQNWYYINVTKKGYVTVSLGASDDPDDVSDGWNIDFMNEDCSIKYFSKNTVKSTQKSCKLALDPGKYYVKITNRSTTWNATGKNYDLKIAEVENAYWESEYNDNKSKADSIVTNTTYHGNLYAGDDADWYVVDINESGYFKLHFKPSEDADLDQIEDGWNVSMYQQDSAQAYCSFTGIKRSLVSAEYPVAPGRYYVKVEGRSSTWAPDTVDYDLKIENVKSDVWEIENNDTSGNATLISTGKEYKGNFVNRYDVDYFKFSLDKASTLSFDWLTKYCVDMDKIHDGWNIYFYKADGTSQILSQKKVVGAMNINGLKLDKGDYYIKVENEGDVDIYNTYAFTTGTTILNCAWIMDDVTKAYWYENGERQGTYSDPQGVVGDGSVRGREICDQDPATRGWYWLDACYDGAKAVSKEVWMPYIYQAEKSWDEAEIWSNAFASGNMAQQVYDSIKAGTGKWVRYDKDGKMYKGWYTVEGDDARIYPEQKGNTYYYDPQTGLMAKGWTLIDGVNYYFDVVTGVLAK